MISQDSFVQMMRDLGDVDAPPTGGRLDGIQHRIKKVRIRRTLTAAVAVIAIVAAGLAVASLRHEPPAVPADVPKSWTTDDGVTYKLVTYVTLDTAHQNSVTVSVPAAEPITVRYTCAAETSVQTDPLQVFPAVTIGAGRTGQDTEDGDAMLNCRGRTPGLADFDQTLLPGSGGVARLTIKGSIVGAGGVRKVFPGKWTFGIYTWVVPAQLRPVPTLPPMPQLTGDRLAATLTAVWPRQRSVTFRVPANVYWGTVFACSDALQGQPLNMLTLGRANQVRVTINGKTEDGFSVLDCRTPSDGDGFAVTGPTSQATTVTITFSIASIYDHRGDVIQVGVYYKN